MRKIATLLLTVALLVCVIPFLTSPGLSASVGQGFEGSVLNDTGAPVSGVLITARNTTTNFIITTTTNGAGAYSLQAPLGTYNVSASLNNFNANTTYTGVAISSDGSAELNFTMSEILGTLHGFVIDGVADQFEAHRVDLGGGRLDPAFDLTERERVVGALVPIAFAVDGVKIEAGAFGGSNPVVAFRTDDALHQPPPWACPPGRWMWPD